MPEARPEQAVPPLPEPPAPPTPAPRPRGGGAKSLFSDHYLRQRLPEHPEWGEDVSAPLAALRALYEGKQSILPSLNEAQAEAEFIRPALEILGFAYIPQASVRRAGRPLRPDYALFADETAKEEAYALRGSEPAFYARALAVADAKYWERPLSEVRRDDARDEFRNTNPSFQIVNYLIGTGVDWGILTNGRTWRLYYRQASSTAHEFYEVDLVEALADEDAFKRFWLFFRCDAFTPDAQGNTFLDRVRMGSDTYARVIGDRLKGLVFGQVFPLLAGGFVAYRHTELGQDTTSEAARQEIYQATLSLLYKLLFLLYAEARDLLPVANVGYQQKSVTRMARDIARRMDRQEPLGTTSTELYDRLLDLFRVIDRGDRGLALPRYNGGLFSARNRANQFLARHKLTDAVLAPALDRLARADGEPIDYGFIGVRHLGAIYEGLLEHRLMVAQRETSEVSTDLGGLEYSVHLETDRGERKATGSYYTPDYIVKYIVAHTLELIIEERVARFDELMARIAQVRDELARKPAAVPAGRQELERLEHQARETLLDIKVCDPAMGSGHFLVEAVDLLTDRLIDVLNQYPEHNPVLSMLDRIRASIVAGMERQGIAVDPRRLDDTQLLTRVVMKRCIYGVDLNEMAVELAKVSLWLHTFTVGAPLSFLDHHLRWGNSLIGAMARDVDREMQQTSAGQLHLFAGPFRGLLRQAEVMRGISVLSDATFEELEKSESLFQQFDSAARPYKKLLDVYVAQYFGVKHADEFLRLYGAEVMEADPNSVGEPYAAVVREARRLYYEEKRFFHWDLEFPEVFIDLEKADWKENPGFDVVVGNPPWGVQLPSEERQYREHVFVISPSSDNSALFMERSITILKLGSVFGYVVPSGWQTGTNTQDVREFLLRTSRLHKIINLPYDVFPAAYVDSTIVICGKDHAFTEGNPIITNSVDVLSFERREQLSEVAENDPRWQTVDYSRWFEAHGRYANALLVLPTYLRSVDLHIAGKIQNVSIPMGEITDIQRGITPFHPKPAKLDDTYQLAIEGELRRYHYGSIGTHFVKCDESIAEYKPPRYFRGPRVLVRELISRQFRLQAVYVEEDFVNNKSTHSVLQSNPRYDLKYILALTNSWLLSYYHVRRSAIALRDDFPKMVLDEHRRLPVRRISFTTTPDERARLVGVGTTEATEFIEHTEGAASVSFSAFSGSVFGRWLDERLSPVHTPDPALVRQHNADPLNKDWQLPEKGPVEQSDVVHDLLAHLAGQMMAMNKEKQAEVKDFLSWLEAFLGCPVDDLSGKTYVQTYHERTFDELLATLKKNRRRIQPDLDRRGPLEALRAEWETSMGKLHPLLARLAATDRLIDLVVYRLYGLTGDEVAVVEGRQ